MMFRIFTWGLVAVVTIVGAQCVQRQFRNDIGPTWTDAEYFRRLSAIDADRDFVFLGDSRAGWGVAEIVVTTQLKRCGVKASAWNLGLAATGFSGEVQSLLANTPSSHGGTVVLTYAPGFFFHFTGGRGGKRPERYARFNVVDEIVMQVVEKTIEGNLSDLPARIQKLFDGEKDAPTLYWAYRDIYRSAGLVQGQLRHTRGEPVQVEQVQIDNYQYIMDVFRENPERIPTRIQQAGELVARLQALGWKVVMIRLPIGPKMREIERAIPPEARFMALAQILKIPAIDYDTDTTFAGLATLDQSHLTVESAVAIAPALARDLARSRGIQCSG